MTSVNEKRLFLASCIALVLTSMTFAIRARLETVFGPAGVGLTLEQIGYAFMPAFWGFTLAMVIGGPIVEYIGMRKGMWLAFILHAIGIVATLIAADLVSLFTATVFIGVGNGMVEAVCNPLVASMYPDRKTKMLNRFHIWFPGGIVIGSIVGYLIMDVAGLGWQLLVATLFVPLVAYGVLFAGQSFPQTERVQMGVTASESARSLVTPLYLFVGFCMLLSASTELGTTQRIESLLAATGVNALLVLAFINGIMMVGRAMAGSIANRISTLGMLWFSAIFSFLGLQLLTLAAGNAVFAAAAVFAVGVTFFWPTTLAFISENLPESGALGLSIMGGLGMLSVSFVLPIMGRILDSASGTDALRTMSILPAILIVLYGGLFFVMRSRRRAPARPDAA
ncbi:MAG: MFS transporter [Woeseiaceae bacterium]|jgi:MFS family permease|nr:MFS transporter [Woeseiaceae bacterium]